LLLQLTEYPFILLINQSQSLVLF